MVTASTSLPHALMRHHSWNLLLLPGLCLLHAACGGDATPPGPRPATVVVGPASDTLRALGGTMYFRATVTDAGGTALTGLPVRWTSTDPAVATVDSTGLATALANGETEIRADVQGVRGSAHLTVRQRVASVTVSPRADTVHAFGPVRQLAVTLLDDLGNPVLGRTVGWAAWPDGVVTVSADGRVTARANGEATVAARADAATGQYHLVVDVRGAVLVRVTTSGGGVDPDGYVATVAGTPYPMRESTLLVPDLPEGYAQVTLSGLAWNCVSWDAGRFPHVLPLDTARIDFAVRCAGRFAFVDGYTGSADLRYVDETGSGGWARVIASGPVEERFRWSPDRTQIAVAMTVNGNQDIYLVQPEGSSPRRLTTSPDVDAAPVWSPDGAHLLYSSTAPDGTIRFIIIGADGSGARVLAQYAPGMASSLTGEWSPRGDEVAFVAGQSVRLINPDGTGLRTLTSGPFDDEPVWSPDGTRIAFTRRTPGGGATLLVAEVATSASWPVATTTGSWLEPAWSPDGRRIAYQKTDATGDQIRIVNADGSGDTRVTGLRGAFAPAWSGDGQSLYFTAAWGTGWAVYLVQPNGDARQDFMPGFVPRRIMPR